MGKRAQQLFGHSDAWRSRRKQATHAVSLDSDGLQGLSNESSLVACAITVERVLESFLLIHAI